MLCTSACVVGADAHVYAVHDVSTTLWPYEARAIDNMCVCLQVAIMFTAYELMGVFTNLAAGASMHAVRCKVCAAVRCAG